VTRPSSPTGLTAILNATLVIPDTPRILQANVLNALPHQRPFAFNVKLSLNRILQNALNALLKWIEAVELTL